MLACDFVITKMWAGYPLIEYTCRNFTLLIKRKYRHCFQRNDYKNSTTCFPGKHLLASQPCKQTYSLIPCSLDLLLFSHFGTCILRMNNNYPVESNSSENLNAATILKEQNIFSKLLPDISHQKTYEETVSALNGLQNNFSTILQSQKDPTFCVRHRLLMHHFLTLLDITQEDLKRLNIIHVAGTKGKGSTCAYTESILRTSGYKTGFFSSPHLVVVRERIRINGKPCPQSDFVTYFWQVYNKILSNEENEKPTYFMFLTLLAFHIFLQEKVDVAVIEVGIGGEYDSTNVISHPAVVGLTSIGLDHISILGDSLEKIAWQKAGIVKEGIPAFTVPQPSGVLAVFLQRASQVKCPLYLSPDLSHYTHRKPNQPFQLAAEILGLNVSLALQLSRAWLQKHGQDFSSKSCHIGKGLSSVETTCGLRMADTFEITEAFDRGIRNTLWLGRFQKLQKNKVKYFLDGAHTAQSIECCSHWFQDSTSLDQVKPHKRDNVFRVLLFNCTKGRKPENLLPSLTDIYFDLAIFCTNNLDSSLDSSSDSSNFNSDRDQEMKQCLINLNMWLYLQSCMEEEQLEVNSVGNAVTHGHCHSLIIPLVSDAISCLEQPQRSPLGGDIVAEIVKADELHVLVTGSLLLVGNVLSVLCPELQSS